MKNLTRIAFVALAVLTCSSSVVQAQWGQQPQGYYAPQQFQQPQPYPQQQGGFIQQRINEMSPQERAMLSQVLVEFRRETGNPNATVEDLVRFYFEVVLPYQQQQQMQMANFGSTHEQRMNQIRNFGAANTARFNTRMAQSDANHQAFLETIRN